MSSLIRLLIAFAIAPLTPALVLVAGSLPNANVVLPIAEALVVYGYLASVFFALPALLIWRKRIASKPVLVLPLAGVTGALVAAVQFVAASGGGDSWSFDLSSSLALVPVVAVGATFGVLSGLSFFFIAGPSLSRVGNWPFKPNV
jgi:hypothetical protein